MAGGSGAPLNGRSGKKAVDFQLNLVPFIDLLSVMISFLMLTAAWTQVSKIDVKQKPETSEISPDPLQKQPEEISVLIKASGYAVTKTGGFSTVVLKKGDTYDKGRLSQVLKQLKSDDPENHAITLGSEDSVPYKELIQVMDLCLEHGLDGISVFGVDT